MDKKEYCGRKDKIVKASPDGAAYLPAQQRRYEDQHNQVGSGGACDIDPGLQVRVDREHNIHDAEMRGAEKEQDCRVRESEEDGDICGPLMEGKQVDAFARPKPYRAVAEAY